VAASFEDFRVSHGAELASLYERARAASWKITEEQWAAAIYSATISGSFQMDAAEWEVGASVYLSSLRAPDLAFALAVRLGCSDAVEHLATRYTSLLRSLAEHIARDNGRVITLTKEVFDDLYGRQDPEGRRRSLFEDFDGRISLIMWLREVMVQREMGGGSTTVPLLHQRSKINSDETPVFLGAPNALSVATVAPATTTAPAVLLAQPLKLHKLQSWRVTMTLMVLIVISVIATHTRRSSHRFAALSLSAIADNRREIGAVQRTLRGVSLQHEQLAFTCASPSFGLASYSSSQQSPQPDLLACDIDVLLVRKEVGSRFTATMVSPTRAFVAPAPNIAIPKRPSALADSTMPRSLRRRRAAGAEKSINKNRVRAALSPGGSYVETKVGAYRSANSELEANPRKPEGAKGDGFGDGTASDFVLSDGAVRKPIVVEAPGHLTRWMLTSRGVIARSSDGVGWRPLTSGTDVDLIAGTAPSADVCWVIGRAGTILRTTDGEQWERIPSPTGAELLSIAARDEHSATVLTVDGRKFATDNGGKTWLMTRD
jgi:hypothetical protein